jgi:hypothetical protein
LALTDGSLIVDDSMAGSDHQRTLAVVAASGEVAWSLGEALGDAFRWPVGRDLLDAGFLVANPADHVARLDPSAE